MSARAAPSASIPANDFFLVIIIVPPYRHAFSPVDLPRHFRGTPIELRGSSTSPKFPGQADLGSGAWKGDSRARQGRGRIRNPRISRRTDDGFVVRPTGLRTPLPPLGRWTGTIPLDGDNVLR